MAARLDIGGPLLFAGMLVLAATVGFAAGIRPEVAIAASLAVAFVVITLADLSAGLVLFTFFTFLEIVPLGGPALSFTKLLGLLLLLSWLTVMTTQRGIGVDARVVLPAAYLLAALLAWVTLSATWAEQSDAALIAASRYLLNAVLFVIIVTSVRERSTAIQLLAAFVAGAGVAAAYGIISPGQFEADYGRIETATLDPNELAAVLVPGFAICLFTAIGMREHPLLRLAAAFVGALCAATVVLTVSRGGLIALVVALVVAVLVGGRWRGWIAMVAVTVAAAGYIYFAGFASDEIVDHLESTTQGDERLQEGRVTIWQVAWRMVEDEPVRGVGAGNFSNSSVHYLLQPGQTPRSDLIVDTPAVAHNTYLGTLAQLGVIGLGLFLALIGFCLVSLARAIATFRRIGDATLELVSRALFAALVGILAADFFISEEFSKALWLLLALGPAMLVVAREVARSAESPGG